MEEMKMKNLMKKSVVSAIVVLVAVSLASADGPAFVSNGLSTRNVMPGETITVDLLRRLQDLRV
jgi:hypothetical protein